MILTNLTGIVAHPTDIRILCVAITAIAFAAMPAADSAAACIDPPAGVTAWWGGDGNAGDVYGAWNGTLVGTASYATGQVGEAFSFDGSGARVDVASPGAGELGSSPFTIDLWFSTDIAGNGTYIIGKSHPDGGQGWDIRLHDRQIQLVGFNGWAINLTTLQIVTLDQWHHLAVTSDGATVTLYFNGATDPTWTIPRQTVGSTGNPLRFGMTTNFGGTPFDGEIDEIRFFDRPLDAAEVAAIFAAGGDGNCRPCAGLPAAALGWWRAEDNGDDAVQNNNGGLDGDTTYTDGAVGRAFSFDGNGDVVRFPDSDVWDFGTGSFSLGAWFRSATPGYRTITRYHNGSNSGSWALRLEPTGRVEFLVIDQTSSPMAAMSSDSVYTDDEWHHVVAVRDATAGELRIYVDGVEAATPVSDLGINVVGASNAKAGIGAGQWGTTSGTWEAFNGSIDEVVIVGRPLDPTEIEMLYNASSSGHCSGCIDPAPDQVGWWRGEGSAFDSAGGHHGTAVNNASFGPGFVGSAIESPGGDDYVEVPHAPVLSFGPTDPMSIELWAYRETDQDAQHILGKRVDCGGSPFNYQIWWHQSAGQLCFGGISGMVCTTPERLPLQTWTHLAASFDGATAVLYVDGQVAAAAAMQLGPDTGSPSLRFGTSGTCGLVGQGFTGLLDEIQLFDRARSRSEVAATFAAGRHGACRECAPLPDGLAAWWRAEGDATDFTGANDGTEMNGAGYGAGLVGRAFDVDDGATPGYIEVPHSASLDITGAFSAEGWLYLDEAADACPFDKGDANGSQSVTSYAVSVAGGLFNVVLYGSYPADLWTSTGAIETDGWHHFGLTWDGSTTMTGNVNLYLDGVLTDAWTKTNPMNSTVESLTIGAMKPPTYYHDTNGRIDELAFYSREITADEIAAIFRAGSAGKCQSVDLEPDPFSFTDQLDVVLDTDTVSNSITVSGIDAPTNIGIASCTSAICEYAVNGGDWTSTAGLVAPGDAVAVRQRSSASFGTTTDLTLDIGGVTDTFSVTTIQGHTLTVMLSGYGHGSVTSTPAGIDCPAGACVWVFAESSPVSLAPAAADGSVFAGWSGSADCSDGQLTMTEDLGCTATFDFLGLFADGFEDGNTLRWSDTVP